MGDRIEGIWKAKSWHEGTHWFEGEVAEINEDGTYKVFWPGWGNHSDCPPEDMKLIEEAPPKLEIGGKASVQYTADQLWYPAEIIEMKEEDGQQWFKFHYQGFPDQMG